MTSAVQPALTEAAFATQGADAGTNVRADAMTETTESMGGVRRKAMKKMTRAVTAWAMDVPSPDESGRRDAAPAGNP